MLRLLMTLFWPLLLSFYDLIMILCWFINNKYAGVTTVCSFVITSRSLSQLPPKRSIQANVRRSVSFFFLFRITFKKFAVKFNISCSNLWENKHLRTSVGYFEYPHRRHICLDLLSIVHTNRNATIRRPEDR